MIYYKYRSLENLRYFIDIIMNKRLYMARYDEFNDPSEGLFLTSITTKPVLDNIKDGKHKLGICSLSKDKCHTLLWAHYANGHRGCNIGVVVHDTIEEIEYVDKLPSFDTEPKPKELLKYKSTLWKYEDEVRVIRDIRYGKFMNVIVKEVNFGCEVEPEDCAFYEKLIKSIDSTIAVNKMEREDINDGYGRP